MPYFCDMKSLLALISVSLLAFASSNPPVGPAAHTTAKRPKNIIFMVGDGMGLTQVTAAMYSNHGQPLHLERCPITGLIKTHASNNLITDSAAGATAFSCGCKTYNGAIGMDADKKPCTTILEEAEKQGLATGLVATSSITHATPASFVAHVQNRKQMEDIATFFLKTEVDFFVGGGLKYFTERTSDQRDLRRELEDKGYFVADFDEKKLSEIMPSPARPFAWFAAREEPLTVEKGRTYLPVAGRMGAEFLKNRSTRGFFLLIEGSQIDWGGHAKNEAYTVLETLDFDKTIGAVLDWAERDGETLVVITADHETGGMAILHGSSEDNLDIGFNTDYHTATMVPVFAFGPGAEQFGGVYDNTDIYWKMRELFNFPAVEAK